VFTGLDGEFKDPRIKKVRFTLHALIANNHLRCLVTFTLKIKPNKAGALKALVKYYFVSYVNKNTKYHKLCIQNTYFDGNLTLF